MSETTTLPVDEGLHSRRLVVADLAATTFFAFEGAIVASAARLDLFGVLVVASVSALGGGTIRDLLTGHVPPASVNDVRYVVVSIIGGTIAFGIFRIGAGDHMDLLVAVDAAGLSLFAVVGALMALDRDLPAFSAALVGTVTAVGGGVMRDLLIARVPLVLREDVYATAALLGATIAAVGLARGFDRTRVAVVGGVACFVLRLLAHHYGWSLPTA